jgi:hypothetical protein
MHLSIKNYLAHLETCLREDFNAEGANLTEQLAQLTPTVPAELSAELHALAEEARLIGKSSDNPDTALAWTFRCGQIYQRLQALKYTLAEETLGQVSLDGQPPLNLEITDVDAITRFIAWRDRVFQKIADFTLKALLVFVGLLFLGLMLGIL